MERKMYINEWKNLSLNISLGPPPTHFDEIIWHMKLGKFRSTLGWEIWIWNNGLNKYRKIF